MMPPKTKADPAEHRKRNKTLPKLKQSATTSAAAENDNLNLAVRRPRRKPKVPYDPFKDEEDAQLELAIRLSLQVHKGEKKQKDQKKVNGQIKTEAAKSEKSKVLKIKSKKISPAKTSTSSGNSKQSKTENATKRSATEPVGTRSPKKLKVEKASDRIPKKLKVEKASDKPQIQQVIKPKEIPTTESFISYVLQKCSSNRDLDLVKQFENTEGTSQVQLSTVPNTVTESESECEAT